MLRSGFFNSKNHDRLYYNADISRLFNSLIIDGVFQNIGSKFIAKPGTGMEVIIPSGMAYFNSTWLFNDTDYVVAIDAAPIASGYSRIDGIFLKMGPEDDTSSNRENTIYYMAGSATSQNPQRPVPTAEYGEIYAPICYVTVSYGISEITASVITNQVGTSATPFVSGILTTIDAGELLTQWEAQFNEWITAKEAAYNAWANGQQRAVEDWESAFESSFINWSTGAKSDFDSWFENIQYTLDGDVAGHLQTQIDDIVTGAIITTSEFENL